MPQMTWMPSPSVPPYAGPGMSLLPSQHLRVSRRRIRADGTNPHGSGGG